MGTLWVGGTGMTSTAYTWEAINELRMTESGVATQCLKSEMTSMGGLRRSLFAGITLRMDCRLRQLCREDAAGNRAIKNPASFEEAGFAMS